MEIPAIVVLLATIIGIMAGLVQVVDYVQKQRGKSSVPANGNLSVQQIDEAPRSILHNLPSRGEFVGRMAEKERALEALSSRWPLACIDGIGGIGKTCLALEVAYACLDVRVASSSGDAQLFDGLVWMTAKDREFGINDLLDVVARTLDYPGITQQPISEKTDSVRKLLQQARYLLIIDNFETVKDSQVYEFLLRLPEPSKALITSREQNLPQAWAVSLKGLKQAEAIQLMLSEARRLGLTPLEEAPESIRLRLYEATGGAPLAIRWAIGQMKQKGQSLDSVLDALYGARGDIFSVIFTRSWELLSDHSRSVLMSITLFATSANRSAIEAVSNLHRWDLEEAIGELTETRLTDVNNEIDIAKQRFSIHPLTRAFGLAQLRSQTEYEDNCMLRMAQYYFASFQRSGTWQGRVSVDRDQFEWLHGELANVMTLIDWCYSHEKWQEVIDLSGPIMHFLGMRGYWSERVVYAPKGIEAASELDDADSEAFFEIMLAWVLQKQGKGHLAKQHAVRADQMTAKVGSPSTQHVAYCILSGLARTAGDLPQAKHYAQLALQLAQSQGEEFWFYGAICLMADNAMAEHDLVTAEKLYQEALLAGVKHGSQERIAGRHIDLGMVYLLQSKVEIARKHFLEAVEISEHMQRQDRLGKAQLGLAKAEEMASNYSRALTLVQSAHSIFVRLAMTLQIRECEEMTAKLKAQIDSA